MIADGPEERQAEQIEREIQGGSDAEIAEQLADEASDTQALSVPEMSLAQQIEKFGATALIVKMQRDSLADTLRDIAVGAEIMLQPAMQASGAFEKFAREVLRIAQAGLKEAQFS